MSQEGRHSGDEPPDFPEERGDLPDVPEEHVDFEIGGEEVVIYDKRNHHAWIQSDEYGSASDAA